MARFWGKKGSKIAGSTAWSNASSTANAEHNTNKLDHVLVAENKNEPVGLKKKLFDNWKLIVVAVVVIVAGASYFAFFNKEPIETANKPYINSEGVAIRELGFDELVGEVQSLTSQKKYNSAEELINFQKDAQDSNHRQLLVPVYTSQEQYGKALNVLLKMEENNLGDKWKVQRNIGNAYEQLKDKNNALVYYKKALESLNQASNVPAMQDEVLTLQMYIKRVEK